MTASPHDVERASDLIALPDADLLREYEHTIRRWHMYEAADVGNWSAEREDREANIALMNALQAEGRRRRLLPVPSAASPEFDSLVGWRAAE